MIVVSAGTCVLRSIRRISRVKFLHVQLRPLSPVATVRMPYRRTNLAQSVAEEGFDRVLLAEVLGEFRRQHHYRIGFLDR